LRALGQRMNEDVTAFLNQFEDLAHYIEAKGGLTHFQAQYPNAAANMDTLIDRMNPNVNNIKAVLNAQRNLVTIALNAFADAVVANTENWPEYMQAVKKANTAVQKNVSQMQNALGTTSATRFLETDVTWLANQAGNIGEVAKN